MNFKISYEDTKKLLGLLYNNPYQAVAPYVEIIHNLPSEIEGEGKSFLHYLEEEKAALEAKLNSEK